MDKRYQVFVSSTFEDLREERGAVISALLQIDCFPAGMELFPAADDDSLTLIKSVIDDSDYYLVILGGRYGSIDASCGKSYTHLEYEYALAAGKPTIALLHSNPETLPAAKTERTDEGQKRFAEFAGELKKKNCRYWRERGELTTAVFTGVQHLKKTRPSVGWVRSDLLPDESAAQEILSQKRRIEELQSTIAKNDFGPPAGTETLSQGEERITIHFRYGSRGGPVEDTEAFSWNSILSALGPVLIDQAEEQRLKDKLIEVFINRARDRMPDQILYSHVRDEDFQLIKLQLRALGWIREVKTQRDNGGAHVCWTLTPYGDRLMTQVAAIRSEALTQRLDTQ